MSEQRIQKQWRQYKPLIHELVIRDLKVKYRRSFLGYMWSLLNPLLMMVVMTLVFSYMFRFDIPNYPMYLICGQTLWGFFNESTNMAMYSVLQNGSLIKKVYVPKFIFPLSRVVSSFVTMMFSMVAILIVMIFTHTPLTWRVILACYPLLCLFIFSLGISFVLSALSVYFRDITHLYGVLTLAWMYCTPIFYPYSAVPEAVQAFIRVNPMFQYIDFFRSVVIYGTIPAAGEAMACLFSCTAALVIGLGFFAKLQKNFILYI